MLKHTLLGVIACGLALAASAQVTDPAILFTVDDVPVTVEEFDYIYAKTNGDSADYSRASLEEYMRLYERFKLKVAKARDMGLDTVPSLNQELAGYRRQLADSYLVDEEVTEPMARELWERKQQDVRLLHIAVDLPKNAVGRDTLGAYQEAERARKRIVEGKELWAKVARDMSTDGSAKRNGGEVGFVTAPLPDGLYGLETAIYTSPVNRVSDIVRSEKGYHLIKVLERRPARGEIEAAHIFLRKPKGGDASATKRRIDSLYAVLRAGGDFEDVARRASEDTRSAPRGGYIGFFGINRYDLALENAAFALPNDGDYSAPVESRVGWHIVKRISRKPPQSWEEAKGELTTRIKRMPRFQTGRERMVTRLQKEYGLTENRPVLDKYISTLPDSFLSYRWRPGPVDELTLFTLGKDGVFKLSDFTDYLRRNASKRIRMEGDYSTQDAARKLYDDFKVDQTLVYAERRLDTDNPAFYNLMREYQEGILLFEATKQNVWDKAGLDTVGLEAFFAEHRDDYQWDYRAVIDVYSMPLDRKDELYVPMMKYAKKHSAEEVLAKFNAEDSTTVTHYERTIERGREPDIDRVQWKPGNATAPEVDNRRKTYRFGIIREVLRPGPKELNEARGYVIADYQDELEKRWVRELAKQYEIEYNRAAFDALVKTP